MADDTTLSTTPVENETKDDIPQVNSANDDIITNSSEPNNNNDVAMKDTEIMVGGDKRPLAYAILSGFDHVSSLPTRVLARLNFL